MSIDHDAVVSMRRLKPDEVDTIEDVVLNEGETVLTLGWDGDRPGGSGAIWVTRRRRLYFTHSSDYDPEGPFSSLSEVLDQEGFSTVTPKPELMSDSVPLRRLRTIAKGLLAEDGDEVWINHERFVLRAERLHREQ